jgi:hypothetical protein
VIGASLTRTMSALSSLFGGGHDGYGGVGRRGTGKRKASYSKKPGGGLLGGNGGLLGGAYEYADLRDPNPPPPALGAGLISIEEGGTENGGARSRQDSGGMNDSEQALSSNKSSGNVASKHASLVLKPLHEKSLSSLRTANSEALERLGAGNWDVVQRLGTGSSRRTDATQTTNDSSYTDLGEDTEMGWRDIVGRKAEGPAGIVESPVDLETRDSSKETFWEGRAGPTTRITPSGQPLSIPLPLSPNASNTNPGPSGPRPIPPPKRVTDNLAQRIEALGLAREAPLPLQSPTSPTRATPNDPTRRNPGVYGLAPKPTLFVANPGGRNTSDST